MTVPFALTALEEDEYLTLAKKDNCEYLLSSNASNLAVSPPTYTYVYSSKSSSKIDGVPLLFVSIIVSSGGVSSPGTIFKPYTSFGTNSKITT